MRVKEYFPEVSRSILREQVVARNQWPTELQSPISSGLCVYGQASIVARWSCEVVVVARRVGAPLRRFVGFELRLAGTAAVWFVDGPLLVISAAVAVPWLLCFVTIVSSVPGFLKQDYPEMKHEYRNRAGRPL